MKFTIFNRTLLCIILGSTVFNIIIAKPIENIEDREEEDGEEKLTTHVIELKPAYFPEPNCHYTVHVDSRNGATVSRKVNIGDLLYHKWKCDYGVPRASELYCIMVYNCTVSSHQHTKAILDNVVEIIDEFGCSLYPTLLPNIVYVDDLEAGLPSNAFALDFDQLAIYFKCHVKMLLKLNGACRRPRCFSEDWIHRPQLQ